MIILQRQFEYNIPFIIILNRVCRRRIVRFDITASRRDTTSLNSAAPSNTLQSNENPFTEFHCDTIEKHIIEPTQLYVQFECFVIVFWVYLIYFNLEVHYLKNKPDNVYYIMLRRYCVRFLSFFHILLRFSFYWYLQCLLSFVLTWKSLMCPIRPKVLCTYYLILI